MRNNNHSKSMDIAQYDTAYICLDYNYDFQEYSYIVDDVLINNAFKSFYIGGHLEGEKQRIAYEDAARYYNELVPESESIPLF